MDLKAFRIAFGLVLGVLMLGAVTTTSASALPFDQTLANTDVVNAQPVWWHHGWHHWGGGWGWHRHHFCYWHPRACGW